MKFLLLLLVPLFSITLQARETNTKDYYEVKKITIRQLKDTARDYYADQAVGNFTQGCNPQNTPGQINTKPVETDPTNPIGAIDIIDVIVDKIINIGKKIWAIVDAGRPVVNVKIDTANALPSGVKCWDELEGWSAPTSRLYEVVYENGFGSAVVTYAYRVSFISGGSFKGQGQYVTLATFQPANLEVSWGFKFDAVASVPMVFNQGTKTNPVAGMQMVMDWTVESPLKQIRQAESYFVNGKGEFKRLR